MECEVCGSKSANRKIKAEGAILNVCDECVKFGQEIPKIEIRQIKKTALPEQVEEGLKPDFYSIIKREREKRNLTQTQLAKKLNEKASIIKRVEEGWEPSLALIKKLERFFNIKLLEKIKEGKTKKMERKELTIGDIVQIKD